MISNQGCTAMENCGGNCKTPQRETQINAAMEKLNKACSLLHTQIEVLEANLVPVMHLAEDRSDETVQRAVMSCPHAEDLAQLRERIHCDTMAIMDILGRLEIE